MLNFTLLTAVTIGIDGGLTHYVDANDNGCNNNDNRDDT